MFTPIVTIVAFALLCGSSAIACSGDQIERATIFGDDSKKACVESEPQNFCKCAQENNCEKFDKSAKQSDEICVLSKDQNGKPAYVSVACKENACYISGKDGSKEMEPSCHVSLPGVKRDIGQCCRTLETCVRVARKFETRPCIYPNHRFAHNCKKRCPIQTDKYLNVRGDATHGFTCLSRSLGPNMNCCLAEEGCAFSKGKVDSKDKIHEHNYECVPTTPGEIYILHKGPDGKYGYFTVACLNETCHMSQTHSGFPVTPNIAICFQIPNMDLNLPCQAKAVVESCHSLIVSNKIKPCVKPSY